MPHAYSPTDGDRLACGCRLAAGDDVHIGPMDDTAQHPDHDGLRAPSLDGWTCRLCAIADAVSPWVGLAADGKLPASDRTGRIVAP